MTKADNRAALDRLFRENAVLEGINRIFREAPSTRSEEQLARLCLAIVEDVTDAAFSFLGEIDGTTDQLRLVISDRGQAASITTDTGLAIQGLYERILHHGEARIANGEDGVQDRPETPAGLPAFQSFLGVPLRSDGHLFGMIGLGNRDGGFRQTDLDAAESLIPAILQVILGKRAETALRNSERRLQSLVNGVPQLVWRAFDGGHWAWASPQWATYTGQVGVESHGNGWLSPVHPEDRENVRRIWADAVSHGIFKAEYRIYHIDEGRYRWFRTRASPVRDDAGRIVEWLGTSTDIDDLRSLQGRQQMLVAELQHRVRNILAVVRSVFARTIESDGPMDDRIDHFKGRLDSLARTQVILTQYGSGTIDLDELVREELLSVGAQEGPSVTIGGPDVALPSITAESLGLALHELTMNAVKYGALKVPGGTLDVRWEVRTSDADDAQLLLTWTEHNVPAIAVEPIHSGFGKEMIERALPYRLGAKTVLEFRGGGVRCSLAIPLSSARLREAARAI